MPPSRISLRDRLVPPYTKPSPQLWRVLGFSPELADRLVRWSAWGGPLLVTLVAGLMRFWRLGSPDAVIFDETYYAKDAWALMHQGYEGAWPAKIDPQILANPDAVPVPHDPGYVVHPPVGKWVIGIGEQLFGFTPFGWRFMTAVLGTLAVLMICRIGRRLLRSTFLGCLAGLLLAVDGLEFVMSRTALLDLMVMFFTVAAFGALLIDRDKTRARFAAALPEDEDGVLRPDADIAETLRLGWRPWRLTAGVMLGLACATKWNGLYILAAFALMSVLWDAGARRTAGAVSPYRAVWRRDVIPAFVSTIPVAFVTYIASWSGWFASDHKTGGYFRGWADNRQSLSPTTSNCRCSARSTCRSSARTGSRQPYGASGTTSPRSTASTSTSPRATSTSRTPGAGWSWAARSRTSTNRRGRGRRLPGQHDGQLRPRGPGDRHPLLWWAGCFALLYVLWRWLFRRDWRAGAIACGIAAGYLPWFMYQQRTIFLFYAVVFVPFICLALAMMIGAILGPPGSSERRRAIGAIGSGVLVLLIIWNFIYFWPIFTGEAIPLDSWNNRMWLNTWV